jgi:peptidoglycan-N-acetylglucosamine deacetylase
MRLPLALAAFLFSAPVAGAPQLAVTFDDLPSHSTLPQGMTRLDIAKATIAALQAEKMPPVIGFTNASLLAGEPDGQAVLTLWRQAGYPLGNHTWSHPKLGEQTLEAYQTDIVRNEAALAELMGGSDWHWFRYPYLAEGATQEQRSAMRGFLAEHGYKIAPATMMFGDWLYSEPYARCLAKHDEAAIATLEKDYLAAAAEGIDYYRAMSQALYGRDIPYVLLLHIGAFEAKTLPQLLALYRVKGFAFVSLEEAEHDPYYKAYTDPALPAPQDIEQQKWAKNLSIPQPKNYEPELEAICR